MFGWKCNVEVKDNEDQLYNRDWTWCRLPQGTGLFVSCHIDWQQSIDTLASLTCKLQRKELLKWSRKIPACCSLRNRRDLNLFPTFAFQVKRNAINLEPHLELSWKVHVVNCRTNFLNMLWAILLCTDHSWHKARYIELKIVKFQQLVIIIICRHNASRCCMKNSQRCGPEITFQKWASNLLYSTKCDWMLSISIQICVM